MLVGTAVLVPEVVAPTPAAASAGAHYVDCSAACGGDGSQQSPWNSMATVSAHAFGPGDQVLFKRGTTCNGNVEFLGPERIRPRPGLRLRHRSPTPAGR